MNELLILGIEQINFKTTEGNDASYRVMYCLGKECNITGQKVIQFIVSNVAWNDFKAKYKNLNEKDLAGKSIYKTSTVITKTHKLKLIHFDVK